jgi:hypothetical protein
MAIMQQWLKSKEQHFSIKIETQGKKEYGKLNIDF